MFGVLACAERLFSRADWTIAHVQPSSDGLTAPGRPVYTMQPSGCKTDRRFGAFLEFGNQRIFCEAPLSKTTVTNVPAQVVLLYCRSCRELRLKQPVNLLQVLWMGNQCANPLHFVGLLQFGSAFAWSITSLDCHQHLRDLLLGRSGCNFWFAQVDVPFLHMKFPNFNVYCIFPECVARVPVSLSGVGGWGCVAVAFAFATVRNRFARGH